MRNWRPFTWVILVVNMLFLIWLITGVGGAGEDIKDCANLRGQALDLCEAGNAGTALGAGIGAFIIIALWAFVDVSLGIIWLVTRKKESQQVIIQQSPPPSQPPTRPDQ
ncbi:MAG TPA: hypothetical protein VJ927_09720 [Actinomycetota bacterium]|nr:hypothetical protein [Actinomycetota bacterium]